LKPQDLIVSTVLFAASTAAAAITPLSDGSDGAFHPTGSITLDLPDDGVFNFTTIDIPTGVTVRFRHNAADTPVILSSGYHELESVQKLREEGLAAFIQKPYQLEELRRVLSLCLRR